MPGGVAYDTGLLYVSFPGRNLIGVYDATSGNLQTTWSVEKPGRLAVAHGVVLAISGVKVVRGVEGKFTDFADSTGKKRRATLDAPAGIALDAAGLVYIANQGALQNVSVFTAGGRYLRSIGKQGGRPAVGAYDPAGMRDAAGIAVDGQGKLWVPETNIPMKRLSVWDTRSGKLLKEFFGGCSYSPFAWIDPVNPHEAFFDNTIWHIDLNKGTWYPRAIFYAPKSANAVQSGNGGFFFPFRVFTAHNGRQYAVSETWAFGPVLWIREGDRFRPIHYLFRNHPNPVLCPRPPFPIMDDVKAYPPGHVYDWVDGNGDEEVQLNELHEVTGDPPFFQWMDAELNLYGDGVIYRPTAVDKHGVPSYDFAKPERFTKDSMGRIWTDSEGAQIWGFREDMHLLRFTRDGQRTWRYPGLHTWAEVMNIGSPPTGTLWGETCQMGMVGRYSALVCYFCTVDIVRDDGLYVAKVFEPSAKGNNGPNIFYVELCAGQMVQPKGMNNIYLLAGDQDCRVSELLGPTR